MKKNETPRRAALKAEGPGRDDRRTGSRVAEFSMQKVGWQTYRTALWRAVSRTAERPLLFFNGIGANLELIQPLVDAMPERDVITFDMPGIGGSPSPVIPYRPFMISHAAATILDRLSFGDVDVLGVSWGGGAAQQFALQYRRRTKRMVLAATSMGMLMVPGNFEALSRMATPQRYADPEYLRKNFVKLYGEEGGTPESLPIKAPTVRGYMYQMLAMVGWTTAPFLPFLNVPALVMSGDRDKIVPLINSKMINRLLPDSTLHIVEGGGHLFIVSRITEIVPVMRAFLDAPPAPHKAYRPPRPAAA